MKVVKGKIEQPLKEVVYGPPGIGKTTFASHYPAPVFFDLEQGSSNLDVARAAPDDGESFRSYEQVMAALRWLEKNEHDFKTVVIDTADALNGLLEAYICKANGWSDLMQPGYGRGPALLVMEWRKVLAEFDGLRHAGLGVLVLSHAEVRRNKRPTSEEFDSWQLKLPAKIAPLLVEWGDTVLFAHFEEAVIKEGTKSVGKRTGRRICQTVEDTEVMAKNRYGLPPSISFDYETIHTLKGEDTREELYKEKLAKAGKEKRAKVEAWVAEQPDRTEAIAKALTKL